MWRFWATVGKTVRPMPSDLCPLLSVLSCLSVCLSVCNVGVLRPNGRMDQDETWHGGRPRFRLHCVMETQPPLKKRCSPQFSAHVCCGQTSRWIKVLLGTEVGLGPGDIVLDGDPVPLPKKGHSSPHFLAHVYCGQTAGCIKMPVGMVVGLGPGDTVLDGDTAPLLPKK